jgi:hypothetical protein
MSSTVTRREFAHGLSADGGSLNINDLPPELSAKLRAAGVDAQDLARTAGADAQLRGEAEMGALFDLLDRLDRNGSSSSFRSSVGDVETPPGAAYDALNEEVARRRLAASSQGVLYLGMRAACDPEVSALQAKTPAAMGGVHVIRGAASNGVLQDDGRMFDLRTPEGLKQFRDVLVSGPDAVPRDRADSLVKILGGKDVANTRDELAAFALALHRAGKGELPIDRLVLSGHGSGDGLGGDNTGWITHQVLRDIARVFPEGAGKIEHLAISACFSAKSPELDRFRGVFPGLKSFWGYDLTSPKAETSAPAHLATWAGLTDGDDPSRVDPKGKNVATWNIVDGEQAFGHVPWFVAQQALLESESVLDQYRSGIRTLSPGGHDVQLERYYQNIQNALGAVDLPAPERPGLLRLRDEVLRLRHPEMLP